MQRDTVIETAKKWYDRLAFPVELDVPFLQLLEETQDVGCMSFSEYDLEKNKNEPEKNLIMFLYFCEELALRYQSAGIPRQILMDTLEDLTVKAKRHYDLTGQLGLSGIRWTAPTLEGKQFRLGRLIFCMSGAPMDIPQKGLCAGDPVVDVHIPAGEPLAMDACANAFGRAEAFFRKFFPEYGFQYYTCFSWLLDDGLKQFLKDNSNILKFQKLFEPVHKRQQDAILRFVFKYDLAERDELMQLPAKTEFAKKVKEHALSGGAFYNVLGVRARNEEI